MSLATTSKDFQLTTRPFVKRYTGSKTITIRVNFCFHDQSNNKLSYTSKRSLRSTRLLIAYVRCFHSSAVSRIFREVEPD